MFERFKKVKELSRSLSEEIEPETDEKGRTVVRLRVTDDDNFLSPFSVEGKPVIAGETAEFLNHSLLQLKTSSAVHFVVSSNVITDEEQQVYEKAIKNYYREEFAERAREIRKNTLASLVMILVGALVFAIAILLESMDLKPLFLNILDVIAWVFVWEAADLFFLQRPVLRKEQLRNLKIAVAEFTFQAVS